MKKQKIVIVMPAYNAGKTLKKTYKRIPRHIVNEVIVVDDASKDDTVKVAKKLPLIFFKHKNNLGYGGNQKTCYKKALERRADIIIMLHPDYQYDPAYIPDLIQPIIDGKFDIILGSRVRNRAETLRNGMPMYKYIGNRILTLSENIILGLNLSEYHTGYRAFHKRVLTTIEFKRFSNDFIFDQEILISAHEKGFRIGEISTPSFYTIESSSINFLRSVKYGISIYILLLQYLLRSFTSIF